MKKLFIKVKCSFCYGSGVYSSGGYKSPQEPKKWARCPYCDENYETYIEPTIQRIIEILSNLPENKRKLIAESINNSN